MAKKKKPPELNREYFVKQGRRGGKLGGAKSWEKLTPEEKTARTKKAVAARKWHPVKPKPAPPEEPPA